MQQCPNDCSPSNTSFVAEWQGIVILSVMGISINGFAHPAINTEIISVNKMTCFDIVDDIISYQYVEFKYF
jgi:hypothetical protein